MTRGVWVAQWVEHLILDFGPGHLMICEIEPCVRLCADSVEPTWDSLSLPFSLALPACAFSLFLSQNKHFFFLNKDYDYYSVINGYQTFSPNHILLILLKVVTMHPVIFLKHRSSAVPCQILSCKFPINKQHDLIPNCVGGTVSSKEIC